MASQPVAPDSSCVEVTSFIRGYHAYQDTWQPVVGEVLLLQRREHQRWPSSNSHEKHAHHWACSCKALSSFLTVSVQNLQQGYRRGHRCCCQSIVVLATAWKYLDPCVYRLYGPKAYLQRLEKIIDEQKLR